MLIAHVLSDLTSLRACGSVSAARALVNVQQTPLTHSPHEPFGDTGEIHVPRLAPANPDLERAYSLLLLHRNVKEAYNTKPEVDNPNGPLAALHGSRDMVRAAAVSLGLVIDIHGPLLHSEDSSTDKLPETTSQTEIVDIQDDDEELSAWS